MASTPDLRRALEHPTLYTLYQKIVGGYKARRYFVKNDIDIMPNQDILDIGCGPGYILDFLPKVNYTGIDIDKSYIQQAKEKYGSTATFICCGIEDFEVSHKSRFDRIIASGVLHHLTDAQCTMLFTKAKQRLKPNGFFISMDGCYTDTQSKIARYLLDKDRGEYIRTENAYLDLAQNVFSEVASKIDESYFNIPYTSIIMRCKA